MSERRPIFFGESPASWAHIRPDFATLPSAPDQRDALAEPDDAAAAEPLRLLLPRGAAWGTSDNAALDRNSVLYRLWDALGSGYAAAYKMLFDVVMESTSVTMAASLDDWENELGRPDPGLGVRGARMARIKAVRTRVLATAMVTPTDFIQLAAAIGYSVTIEEPLPFECGMSECGGDDEIAGSLAGQIEFDWIVRIDGTPVRYFEAGISECGTDALTDWDPAQDIECLFRRIAPAWTRPIFHYP